MGKALKPSIHLGQFQVATLGIFLSATFCAPPTQAQAIVHPQLSPTPRATPTPQGIRVPPPASGRVIRAQLAVVPLPRNVAARCPTQVNFTGSITTNGPAEVRYTWVSFDGGTWPEGTLRFSRAGTQTVREQVTQSGTVRGWLQLKVVSPNAVFSPRAQYVIHCPAANSGRVVRAQLMVRPAPTNAAARCPVTENFTGAITTNGPADVTYTWVSFDGGTWPQATLHFTKAEVQRVRQQVTQGAVHGWLQLKVLSPKAMLSPRAEYVIRCPTIAH